MSTLYQKKIRPILALATLGLLALLIAACSDGSVPTTGASQVGNSLTSTFNDIQATAAGLQFTSSGYAVLTWNPVNHSLTVTMNVAGLPPNSTHPAHIHTGDCSMMGNIIYPLHNVVADSQGKYVGTTVIPNVINGIPHTGWYINIHHGPTLADANQMAPIACGNIVNSNPATDHVQVIKAQFSGLFINQFTNVSKVASTVPGNGDVNPYGTALVQQSMGKLVKGNILVSNFNNGANKQGLGSTIVQISPDGQQSLFAQLSSSACPDGIGLTTALAVLKRGWVIVGSLPAANGQFANARAGCLIVLDSHGKVAATWKGNHINGPWDAFVQENAAGDHAALFVTNVLNGTVAANTKIVNQGTVVRLDLQVPAQDHGTPQIASSMVIGNGFAEKTDAAALVIGPTGVALGPNDILYVSDTLNNRIIAIPNALYRTDAVNADQHVLTAKGSLNGELGLTIAPNGDILTVNGNDGNLVETTPTGVQIAVKLISNMGTPPGAGCLFNLAVVPSGSGLFFVDDCTNQLNLFH